MDEERSTKCLLEERKENILDANRRGQVTHVINDSTTALKMKMEMERGKQRSAAVAW